MTFRRPTRTTRSGALLGAAGLLAGVAVALAPSAPAATVAHNPVGGLYSDRTTTATGIALHGWAVDGDDPIANAGVYALVDGVTRVRVTTTLADPATAAKHHTGPTPDFRIAVPVPSGTHTVCVAVHNTGPGTDVIISCLATPLGRRTTAAERATHSPQGPTSSATATSDALRVTGWATDPDLRNKHLVVVLYVDGRPAVTAGTTSTARATSVGTIAPAGAGGNARYDITAAVGSGTHQACVWVVNVGWGSNAFLGCNAVDTRGNQPIAAGAPSTAILPSIVSEAKRHIGQPYVWGATGPKSFDCSGLVLSSYRKFGFTTPRISEDQSQAARLIPASHARPGDLVFYHDSEGDVYHVGIYLGPLQTVAAIDEAEGVDYQHIWDPSTATYGSFTHL